MDPLATRIPNLAPWSPYNYGYDNPLRFNDPTGMLADGPGDDDDQTPKLSGSNEKEARQARVIQNVKNLASSANSSSDSKEKAQKTVSQTGELAKDVKQGTKEGIQDVSSKTATVSNAVSTGAMGGATVALVTGEVPAAITLGTVSTVADAVTFGAELTHVSAGGTNYTKADVVAAGVQLAGDAIPGFFLNKTGAITFTVALGAFVQSFVGGASTQ